MIFTNMAVSPVLITENKTKSSSFVMLHAFKTCYHDIIFIVEKQLINRIFLNYEIKKKLVYGREF